MATDQYERRIGSFSFFCIKLHDSEMLVSNSVKPVGGSFRKQTKVMRPDASDGEASLESVSPSDSMTTPPQRHQMLDIKSKSVIPTEPWTELSCVRLTINSFHSTFFPAKETSELHDGGNGYDGQSNTLSWATAQAPTEAAYSGTSV